MNTHENGTWNKLEEALARFQILSLRFPQIRSTSGFEGLYLTQKTPSGAYRGFTSQKPLESPQRLDGWYSENLDNLVHACRLCRLEHFGIYVQSCTCLRVP